MLDLLPSIAALSDARRAETDDAHKATWGQYFTPTEIAAFMAASIVVRPGQRLTVLDPGAGTGVLGAAAVKAALAMGAVAVQLIAVEADPGALPALHHTMAMLRASHGARVTTTVRHMDFLDLGQPALGVEPLPSIDVVIANPPYFKMSPTAPRGGDAPNVYARFMEVAASLLSPGGQLLFIIPRSFTSGLYFQRFRERLHRTMTLRAVHVFDSRRDAFKGDGVLQENIIVEYHKGAATLPDVTVTSSAGANDLSARRALVVPRSLILRPNDEAGVLMLPTDEADVALIRRVLAWPGRLRGLGLEISTGPVVPFRTDSMRAEAAEDTVPLLWMQHVRPDGVRWPLGAAFRKHEHLQLPDLGAASKLVVPNQTYVLMRRFSAKEEARRLTVAVLRGGVLPGPTIALENHLNYIHRPGGQLETALAFGLAAVLASTICDDYFRTQSGNTQVSATELRLMPLPARESLIWLGEEVLKRGEVTLAQPETLARLIDEEEARHGGE